MVRSMLLSNGKEEKTMKMKKNYLRPEAVAIDFRYTTPLLSESVGMMNQDAAADENYYQDALSHSEDGAFDF